VNAHVFVYGTLRTPVGGPAGDTHYHGRIRDGIISAAAARLANAVLVDFGSYPGVGPGEGTVRGEVFTISEEALADADVIEGHPDFYERRLESIDLDDGRTVEAWVYWAPESLLSDPANQQIESGDWFDRERLATFAAPLVVPDDPKVLRGFERLTAAEHSWLSSTRQDGKPHNVPMWHVVIGNRIYFATMRPSTKLDNISRTPHVVVSHPDPRDVAIFDGWAIEADHLRPALQPLFLEKYNWDFGTDTLAMIEVAPQVFRTWTDEHNQFRVEL